MSLRATLKEPGKYSNARFRPYPTTLSRKQIKREDLDDETDTYSSSSPPPPPVKRSKGSSGISGKRRSDGLMIVKGNWTDQEDDRLMRLVSQDVGLKQNAKGIASTRWSEIAKELPGRVGKQCRER